MEHILKGVMKCISFTAVYFLEFGLPSFSFAWIHNRHHIGISSSTPLSGFTGLNTLLGQGISGSGTEVRRLGYLLGTEVKFPCRFGHAA